MGSADIDLRFDLPPHFAVHERRLTRQALERWLDTGRRAVVGFADRSLLIADPGGMAHIETVGSAIVAAFGLAAGMALDGRDGLAAELCAACDLIAIDGRPLPFEANLVASGGGIVLVRGIALPLAPSASAASPGEQVQAIISWRYLLSRSAAARLRREVRAALRMAGRTGNRCDPFAPAPDGAATGAGGGAATIGRRPGGD
jgi:hypothetical protein